MSIGELLAMSRRIEELEAKIEAAERERDEAQAAYRVLGRVEERLRKSLISERDEARAQVAVLVGIHRRYERLRILGCAPCGSAQLEQGTVLRFQMLDEFIDNDICVCPSRGEALSSLPEQAKRVLAVVEAARKDVENGGEVTGPIYHREIRKALAALDGKE